MVRKVLAILLLLFISSGTLSAEPTKGPLHSITLNEFLQLPEDFQVIYVAGAIDGMTFLTYGYAFDNHDELVECYRRLPLGEFTSKVVDLAKTKHDFKENVATLVAMTAGNLCR